MIKIENGALEIKGDFTEIMMELEAITYGMKLAISKEVPSQSLVEPTLNMAFKRGLVLRDEKKMAEASAKAMDDVVAAIVSELKSII